MANSTPTRPPALAADSSSEPLNRIKRGPAPCDVAAASGCVCAAAGKRASRPAKQAAAQIDPLRIKRIKRYLPPGRTVVLDGNFLGVYTNDCSPGKHFFPGTNVAYAQGLRALASQCGSGAGSGFTSKSTKPASSSQPFNSSDENTQPLSVVSAMVTANRAENCGAVCVGSVIMSITCTMPPGFKASNALRASLRISSGDS